MSIQPKASFNIAEVASLADVKPHVLRYWETEFPQLDPEKNSAGQRVYRQKDVDLVLHIKRLLYGDQYTIAGARARLEADMREARKDQLPLELNWKEAELVSGLVKARRQIAGLIEQLSKEPEGIEE